MSGYLRAVVLSLPIVALFMGGAAPALAAKAAPEVEIDAVVARVGAEFMADPHAVGISIGVLEDGRTHRYHFGTTVKGRQQAPGDGTVYPIASLTKTFTGSLLAQAALDRKLKLDDDIRAYLDGDYPNLAFEGQPIRLYHLLNHRSGLPFVLPNKPEASPDFQSDIPFPRRIDAIIAGTTRPEFYAGLHRLTLAAAPGKEFQYSNAAAQLAGYILERVSGSSFENLVQTRIAAPLGMRDTFITPTARQKGRLASGYDENGALQAYPPDQSQAAGALKSTLPDMLAYVRWQAAENDPAVRLSHQPTWRDDDYAIGLNWQMMNKGGRRVIFQDGAVPGFASLVTIHPESGIAVVLMSNELDSGTLGRLRAVANGITKALDADALPVP
jgi:D-alanyl-D-alanine-carboxypeptidase/D-alanyl-D-alanine-endopeptidase